MEGAEALSGRSTAPVQQERTREERDQRRRGVEPGAVIAGPIGVLGRAATFRPVVGGGRAAVGLRVVGLRIARLRLVVGG